MPPMPPGTPIQYGQYNSGLNGRYPQFSLQSGPLAFVPQKNSFGSPSGSPFGPSVRNEELVAAEARRQSWQREFLVRPQTEPNGAPAEHIEDRVNGILDDLAERGYI